MHAYTIHIITQCNQIINFKNINVLSVKVKIKSHENVIISGTYHYVHVDQHNNENVHQQHHAGIQKSLQNTSPQSPNAAVKSVVIDRLLAFHLKSRTPPPSLSPSGMTSIWGCVL